jgi:hypothetical protein
MSLAGRGWSSSTLFLCPVLLDIEAIWTTSLKTTC